MSLTHYPFSMWNSTNAFSNVEFAREIYNKTLIPRQIIQFSNSDISTNINNLTDYSDNIPIFGNIDFSNLNNTINKTDNTEIVCNFTGVMMCSITLSLSASLNTIAMETRIRKILP